MRYEWDPAKEAANERKHEISFDDAATVFDDRYHYLEDSTKAEYGEVRHKAVGQIGAIVVAVIFTDRGDRRRIISARRARRHERVQYDQGKAAS